VAWIAERKDVLSGVFFMLTLLAYAGYAMRPFSWWRYLSVIVFFALGLMAKPMLVTLPCVLLLLDYWPLKRLRRQAPDMGKQATTVSPRGQNVTVTGPTRQATIFNWRVLWEKLPLLALTAISCRLTVWAQANVDAFKELALQWRAGNAAVSTVVYLGQLFYPANLAAFYPHPASRLPEWQIVAALATLAAISAAIAILARKRGYLVVGWLWYLGMLAPVCGLLQVGTQGHADRYTYLPQIGLCIAIAWAVAELTKNWCWQKLICGSASAIVIAALMWCAWRQTGYWRDSETLWRHAIDCIPSDFAYNNLGAVLGEAGKTDEAIECYKRAIAINPRHAKAHNNLGLYYYKHGKLDEAVEHYRLAVANERLYAEAYNNLGAALYGQGKTQEAIEQFQLALEIDPEQYMALHNLGAMRAAQGKVEEAIGLYLQALQSKPRYFDCYRDLAVAYARIGKFPEAVSAAEKALALADASQAPAIRAQLEFYRAGKSPR
jgi:tetratricopeptide (TPR) repeat protein